MAALGANAATIIRNTEKFSALVRCNIIINMRSILEFFFRSITYAKDASNNQSAEHDGSW